MPAGQIALQSHLPHAVDGSRLLIARTHLVRQWQAAPGGLGGVLDAAIVPDAPQHGPILRAVPGPIGRPGWNPKAGRAPLGPPPADLHEIPAAGVRGEAETIWFLDHESASKL